MCTLVIDYEGIHERIDRYVDEIMEEHDNTVGGLPALDEIDLMYLHSHIETMSLPVQIAISVIINRFENFDPNLTECNINELQPLTHQVIRKFLQDELMLAAQGLVPYIVEETIIIESDSDPDDDDDDDDEYNSSSD